MGKRVSLYDLADAAIEDDSPAPRIADEPSKWRQVPTSTVAPNPQNPRSALANLDEIVDSARALGILQAITVCSVSAYAQRWPEHRKSLKGYQWVALMGNIRLEVARQASLDEVPVVVDDSKIDSMFEVILVENGHRRDLDPLHEAETMANVLRSKSMSQNQLGKRIGKSGAYISQRLTLLDLIPEFKAALVAGELTIEQGRKLGECTAEEQEWALKAGKPYKVPTINAVNSQTRQRSRKISVSTPTAAADSIRKQFTSVELRELITLLMADQDAPES